MNRPFTSRRTHLLARSALCGVLAAMTMSSSALAQVTGVGTVTSTTSNGGAVGVASGGGVTDITTNASRSIVNWNALTVSPTEALNFHFDDRSDIVVNRVTGAASINGTLSGCMATCAVTGGNIWVLSTGGVLIGANAQVNTGGFLASTASLSDADILDGDLNFAFTGAPTNSTISVANGASLNTNGSSLALIAPIVTTAAGSTVTATNGGDVIYGAAENYNVTFAPTATDDLDLLTFQVPSQSDGSNGTPGITLNGTTTANQVFAAVVSKASVATSILLGGNITATTASGENGDIVLSAGAGFTNGVGDTPMGFDAGITQNTTSTLTGTNVTLRASDTIIADEINATGRVWLNSEWTSIGQTGAITADRLRAEAGGDVILTNTGNDFNFLSYIEAQGVNGIDIIDLDGFVIDNYVFHFGGGARTASLTALTGSISGTGSGVIQVGMLNVSAAGGGIDLGSAASNTTNLGTITAGAGEFRYRSLLDVNVAGVITASNVSLSSIAGQITQSGTGSILTGQLTASAGTGLSLNSALNDVDTVTRLTSGSGDVAYTDADGFDLTGNVGGRGAVTLTAGGSGSITQSAGTIFADTLTALAGSGITLDQINQVVNIGDLTAGGSGDIVYRDADDFALTGNVSAVGNEVTFRSNTGGITQTAFGAITANTLTASAAGNITLFDGVNNAATIGGLASVNGEIVYRDVDGFDIQGDITANGATTLGAMLVAGGTGGIIQTSGVFDVGYFRGLAGGSITLGGANQIGRLISTVINNGTLTLNTTSDLVVDGTVVANTVSLSSPGAITQNSNAQIWANTLNASGVTGINLTASGFGANNIGNLGVLTNTTSGGIAISNAYSTMSLTGNVTAAGQAVSIGNSMGAIGQTGGVITAGSLSLSAADGINASRNNVFDSLDAVTAGGDVAIVNVGDLTLTGDVNTSGDLTLTSLTGEMEQTGGVITAARLNATGVGGIDFDRANSVSTLGTINAGSGAFTFQNLGSFQLNAAVSATSVDLTSNTGAITSGASGTITATDLTVSAVTGIDLSNANNVVANIAGLANSTSGDLVYAQTNGFQITGAVTATNQGMSLSSLNGTITQTAAGIITTDYLNAGAGDDLFLGQANVVGGVGNLLAGGGAGDDLVFNSTLGFNINGTLGGDDVSLTSSGSIGQGASSRVFANLLTLDAVGSIYLPNFGFGTGNDIDAVGLVTAGGAVSIGSISALDLTADVDTNGADLSLFSQLGITQSGGVLKANTLSGQAMTGGITLNRANQVAALGHIFADGASDFTFRNTGDIVLNGLTQASGNTITLTSDTGSVVQNGPGMTAATLSVSAQTGINLGRTNNVGTLGGLTTTTGDITFRNLVSIAAPALTTPGTLTLISDSGSVTQTGAFNAASLFVSGQTGVTLNTQVNDVDTVLGLAAGAGDVLFRDADGFNLAGNVTSADIVSLLNGTGSITQSAGIITTNLLSATSADNITLDRANQVSAIGSLIAGGDITFASTLGLIVLNEITGDDVSVTSGATFTQDNDGDVHASRLTIGAATGISLTNSGNTVSTIAGLSNSTSGGIAFGQTNGIQISGGVLATGQAVSLSSVGGAITQNSGSGIVAGTLNASATGTLTLNQGNDVGNLGVIGTGGSFLFRDVNGFNLTDNVTVGSQLVMLAQNGSITQTGGIIASSDINALASVDVLLGSANQIGSISSLSASRDLLYRQVGDLSVPAINVGGALGLYSTTGSVTQTGQLIAGVLNVGAATGIDLSNSTNALYGVGDVTNTTSGGISLKSQVGTTLSGSIAAAGHAVTLVSYAFSQQAAASITAGSLTGSTYTNANFSGVNDVDAFNFVSDQFVTFQDIDGFDIDGAIVAANVNLISGDAISEAVGGGIFATNLSLTAASANLLRDNDIQNLSSVSVIGDMTFRDINAVSLTGDIVVDGTLSLIASNGSIAQVGGRLDVGRLNASASQDVILSRPANTIDRLGTITTTIGSIDIATNGPLQIDGVVSAAGAGQSVLIRALDDSIGMTTNGGISAHDVSLQAAGNVVLGNIDASGTLDVTASAGSITSIAASVIEADLFVGSATGDIVLSGSAVDFNRLGRVDAGGVFSIGGLVGDVDLTDTITATTVTLISTGALTQSAGLITADAATLGGVTVALNQANAIDTVSLNGTIVGYTNAGSFAANVIGGGAISLTSTTGKITQTASTGRVVANSLTASAATGLEFFGGQNDIAILAGLSSASGGVTYRDTGGFDIAGAITAAGQAVELISDATGADGNDITQSGGVITANRLNGNSAGDVLLTQANAVGGLGLLNANGDFTYRGAGGVSLVDNLSAGSVLTLISDTGGIMQNGGVVMAQTLNASSAFGVALSRQNDVETLGDIDGGVGEFAFRDIDGLDLVGTIQADFGIILQTGGALSQSGGSLATANLQLFSDAAAILNGNNDIDNLGGSNVLGALSFSDVDGFTIDAGIRAGTTLTFVATTGDIVELTGGALDAQTLNVTTTNGDIDLSGDNAIGDLAGLSAGGDVTFHSAGGFTVSGDIRGDAVQLTAAAGAIDQTAGSIIADSLYASAMTGLNLSAIGNDVDVISGLVNATSGGISYHNARSVSIDGAVTAIGQTVNFDVSGDVNQTVTGVITAGRVQGASLGVFALADAANAVTQLGPISADSIAFATTSDLLLTGALYATNSISLEVEGDLTQTATGTITGNILRAQAGGDIVLDQANDLNAIQRLSSDLGDLTYVDIDGFSIDAGSFNEIWTSGTLTLTAGGIGDIDQTGAGLGAGTLVASAGGHISLTQVNQVTRLGTLSAAGLIDYSDFDDIALTDDITAGGSFNVASPTGAVTQTGGRITATSISGQSVGAFILNSFDADLNSVVSTAGDVDIGNTGDIFVTGLVKAGASHTVSLTTGGSIGQGAGGRIESGTLNLSAGTVIDLTSASRNDIDILGGVTAGTTFAFIDDNDFALNGDIDIGGGAVGTTADLRSIAGRIDQTGGAIAVDGLNVVTATGADFSGANRVGTLGLASISGTAQFTNAQELIVSGASSGALVSIRTTDGQLTVAGPIAAGSIALTGADGVVAFGLLLAARDVTVTATTGNAEIDAVIAGDDVSLLATNGFARLGRATLDFGVDSEGDGQNLSITASGDAILGGASQAAIAGQTLTRTGGSGTVAVSSTGGNAGVFLSSMDTRVDTLSAGGVAATASAVVTSGDALLGTVSGNNVLLKAIGGDIDVGGVAIGGGDYTLYGQDISAGAFGFTGTARDISLTDTVGDLTVGASMAAQRNLTIDVLSGSVLDGTGNTTLVAGVGGPGDLSIRANDITIDTVGASNDVTLDGGPTGNITVGTVVVADDYTLIGDLFSTGALSPIGATTGTWTMTHGAIFDFTGQTLTYNGDIAITAADDIGGGNVQSIFGSVLIHGLSDIDIEGLYAATDVTVDAADDLILDSVTASGGDIILTGRSIAVEGFAEADRNVQVTSADGAADVEYASAGGDIVVSATNGDARIGQAILTGATGDLTVSATNGNATLGAADALSIALNNGFDRAVGSAGTVSVNASGGRAAVYLDHSESIDLIQGDSADVTIQNGDLTVDVLDALNGDVYAEALDGSLTVVDATAASGSVGLYAGGGALNLLGTIYGATGITAQADGLLDGRSAISIDSGADLELTGGTVLMNAISATGDILVEATDGDAYVAFADAGAALQVGSLTGDATLRGARAPDSIALFALNTVTFGADDRASITSANYGDTTGGCGCLGGISVLSLDGNAVVNLDSVNGIFNVIGAAIDGNANVVLKTGDLTIAALAGFNIDAEAEGGAIEIGDTFLSGGDYRLKAQDFLGNALTPNLTSGTMNDYALIDTLGSLDTGAISVVAQGNIVIDVRGSGVLTGSAQLTSTDGDITVLARQIRVDSIDAAADVMLNASAGVVDVLSAVTVGGDYTLIGHDFSAFALTPQGARAGTLSITDTVGGLSASDPLTYGGDINITAVDTLSFDTITSLNGDILLQASAVHSDALSAANGRIDVDASNGAALVNSATAANAIALRASGGRVALGSASLLGTGTNALTLDSISGGDAYLGADSVGTIAATNVFTSAGSSTTARISAAAGDAFVNLDASDALTSIQAARNVGVVVRTGALTIDSLSASTDANIAGGGDVRLTDATIGRDLTVDAAGTLTLDGPVGVHSGRITADGDISLTAGGGIMQAATAGLTASGLTVDAGDDVSLNGANGVAVIRAADVTGGDFAYRSTRQGGFDIAGSIDAAGHTVDLNATNGGISQSGGVILADRLTGSSDGGVYLAGGNLIGQLGDFINTGAAFFLNVDQALTIVGTVDSTATLRIQSQAMTIAATGTVRSTTSGDAVILSSDGVFTNNSGADGVQAPNGRWLIYSQAAGNPAGSTSGNVSGGLAGKSFYGSAYDFATGAFSVTANVGNRFVYAYQPTLTVTPTSQQVTYNGQIPTLGSTIAGLMNGDSTADAWSGAPTLSGATSRNVGTYGLSATPGSLLSDMNYAFAFGSGTLTIDPKALTGTVTAASKTYDGLTDATGSIILNGVVAGDVVGTSATGFSFADRNAGLGKVVTAMGAALSGADAGNYTLSSVGTGNADILRRSLSGTLTANSRTYDGTPAATGSIGLTGVVAGDGVTASGTLNFADKSAGLDRTVTASGLALSGTEAGNYDLGSVGPGLADILRRAIGGAVVADSKTYDGSTAATGSVSLTGVLAGDDIRAGGTLAFDDRNAGVGRGVSATNANLIGTDAGNYALTGVANGIANILRRNLSVTADDQSKRFGQVDPSLTYVVGTGGLVQGDALTGGLTRAAGEASGAYVIGQGDLAASSNYILNFTSGEFLIRIPPAGGVQSLQMLRGLGGDGMPFALDRDPSPGLIVDGEDEQDPDAEAAVLSTSN